MQCEKQQDRAMHAGRFQAFTKFATVLVLLHKTYCKKPSLRYYHRVVNAALPQFLPCSNSVLPPIQRHFC